MNSQVINVQLAGGRKALLTQSQITMNIYRKPNLLILVLCASQKAFPGIVTLSGGNVFGGKRRIAKGTIPSMKNNTEITIHDIWVML